jgi:hypothetical protein
MVRKKIGIFQKFLAQVGKRLQWWRAEKMDLYVLALMARETVIKYRELLNGNLPEAVNTLKEQFASSARTYLQTFMSQLKLIVSKDLSDITIMSDVSLYSILGPDYKQFFSNVRYVAADDPNNAEKLHKFVTLSPKCVLCSVIGDLKMEEYIGTGYGEIISYALASLLELIFEYIGTPYTIELKETRCFLTGSPFGEGIMYLHEKKT